MLHGDQNGIYARDSNNETYGAPFSQLSTRRNGRERRGQSSSIQIRVTCDHRASGVNSIKRMSYPKTKHSIPPMSGIVLLFCFVAFFVFVFRGCGWGFFWCCCFLSLCLACFRVVSVLFTALDKIYDRCHPVSRDVFIKRNATLRNEAN